MLVSSEYDRFILEEDGRIEEKITREYTELSLTNPPCFIRANDANCALKMLEEQPFDLIITLFNIGSLTPFEFAKQAKAINAEIPTVLLTSFSHEITRRLSQEDTSAIDYVFGWQGNTELLLAIIKMIEDRYNAPVDILENGVQAILLVEDSVRFYSAYLPDLYSIIIRQTNDFAREALNTKQRNLRKRARPKILFARTQNEASKLYKKYRQNLLGVISDVSFKINPADPEITLMAGVDLCRKILKDDPSMPCLLQSSDSLMIAKAQEMGVDFIDKNSKTLLDQLADFIKQRLAFGRFSFCDPQTGEIVAQAENLEELHEAVYVMSPETITYYAKQHMFSKWLYARGLFSLASTIRATSFNQFDSTEELRSYILNEIEAHRRQSGQGVIAEFDPETYNKYITFARSGNGSLGGKARGLAFIATLIETHNIYDHWENVLVTIPRTFVATTEHFDKFMDINELHYIMSEQMDDNEVLSEFMSARLDDTLVANLRLFVNKISRPLAIRSSSLLEDSHYQPFAGVYNTYMVPFVENRERMLRLVLKAIKGVYASVYYSASRAYIEASGNILAEEKMGIVIQELCGSQSGNTYYPTLSGMARSLNFYPTGDELPEEGVCNIAMGLGKAVVDGGATLRFSPIYPKHALQLTSPELALRDAQRYIYALDMNPGSFRTSTNEAINLLKIDVQDLKDSPHIRYTASTWDMQNNRLSDSPIDKGRKVITFAPILKYDLAPLADIINYILRMGSESLQSPVEIEFALNMDVPNGTPYVFNLLQIRPIVSLAKNASVDWDSLDASTPILTANKALGTGIIEGLCDIVYVRPEVFNAANNTSLAGEIAKLNATLTEQGRPYILIGPGRWGSSDPWLGIPVKWNDISGAKLIAECGKANYQIDPSQGTHFFQNLTSFGVGYITLNPDLGDGSLDFALFDSMPAIYQSDALRHVQFDAPLMVVADGFANRAIVKKHD